jgi:hypothetical protein
MFSKVNDSAEFKYAIYNVAQLFPYTLCTCAFIKLILCLVYMCHS